MEKIQSFTVNHNVLMPGIYTSRHDKNTVTYDLRITRPNMDFMPISAMHTIEHLGATYLRNSKIKDDIVYFGPMGCATGFYLVAFDNLNANLLIEELQKTFEFISIYEGDIPGVSPIECGNYLSHNLSAAKIIATDYCEAIKNYKPERMTYPE